MTEVAERSRPAVALLLLVFGSAGHACLLLHYGSWRVGRSGWLYAYDRAAFLKWSDFAHEARHLSFQDPDVDVLGLLADDRGNDARYSAELRMDSEYGRFAANPADG